MARSSGVVAVVVATCAIPCAAAEDSGQCELHVWPAQGVLATRHSLADHVFASGRYQPNFYASGSEDPTTSAQTNLPFAEEPLPTSKQVEILRSLPLTELMGTPNYRVIFHDEALDSLIVRRADARYLETDVRCYADVVLSEVVFSLEHSRGQNLKSFIRFREFADGVSPVRSLSTWVQTKLEVRREGKRANIPASNMELQQALITNFEKFAGYLRNARRKEGRGH